MIVLGSSGSIGRAVVELAYTYGLQVEGLCVSKSIEILNQQIKMVKPKFVIIGNEGLKSLLTTDFRGEVYCGKKGIIEALNCAKTSLVVNALVGSVGLEPSLCALKLGKKLALANKESLVMGGFLMSPYRAQIIPIDSEHFALAYLLGKFDNGTIRKDFNRLVITASGGAFRDIEMDKIPEQKAKDALCHPNWEMGNKITVDSATMANKLFEVMEAFWLFDTHRIEAYIERSSHAHAFVEFLDRSVVGHFGYPTMRLPILFALKWGLGSEFKHTISSIAREVSPLNLLNISFKLEKIDELRYPIWGWCKDILNEPKLGIVINAANEVAVEYFLKDEIHFGEIAKLCSKAMREYRCLTYANITTLEDVLELDKRVRDFCVGTI